MSADQVQGVNMAPFRHLYPWTGKFLEVSGGKLHYLDEGQGSPFLCVHGNPSWSFLYRKVVERFSDRHRMIVPDHIGCGLSDKPQDWTYRVEDHISNLEALVLELDLKNITLLCHDWGGAIGMGVAGRHPERFSRIMVANTAAFCLPILPLRIRVCRIPGFGDLAVRGLNGFAVGATVMAVEKPMDPATKAGFLAPYSDWQNRIATLRFVEDIPMSSSHPSWDTLQGITANLKKLSQHPLGIFWGMQDWCFSPPFLAEWQKHFPKAPVARFEDAGHYLLEDRPQEILQAMEDFLAAHPVSEGQASQGEG